MSIGVDVRLTDNVSSPAKQAAKSVGRIGTALNRLDKQLSKFDRAMSGVSFGKLDTLQGKITSLSAVASKLFEGQKIGAFAKQLNVFSSSFDPSKGYAGFLKLVRTSFGKDMARQFAPAVRIAKRFGDVLKRLGLDYGTLGEMFGTGRGFLTSVLGKVKGLGASAFNVISGGAMGAVAAVAALVVGIGYLVTKLAILTTRGTLAFAKFTIETATFQDATIKSMELMLKSRDAAEKLYDQAVEYASLTPFQTKDVLGGYQQLLAAGFKGEELKRTFEALGDLAAVKGQPEAIPALVRQMGQIRSKGRLLQEDLSAMADWGLKQESVYEQLAGALGKPVEEIKKLAGQGKIGGKEAIEAIVKSMEKDFGGMAKALSGELKGLFSTLRSRPFELFDKALRDGSGGLRTFVNGFKEGLKVMVDFFNPSSSSGKRVVALIQQVGTSLENVFGVSGEDFGAFLTKSLSVIETILPVALKFLEGFGEGFKESFEPIMKALGSIPDEGGKLETLGDVFKYLGKGVGTLVGLLVQFAAIAAAVTGYIMGGFISSVSLLGYVFDVLFKAVTGAVSVLSKALSGLGKIGSSIGSFLGISPAVGTPTPTAYAGEGQGGIGGNTGFRSLTESPTVASPQRNGGQQTTQHNDFTVNVTGAVSPEDILSRARAEMVAMFKKLVPGVI